MSERDSKANNNNGYSQLQKLLEKNSGLLSQMESRNQIKKVIVEAAVHYFSKLSPQEQLKTVAEYLEKIKSV